MRDNQLGKTLDPFSDRYAARTRGLTVSEIRALFAVASRPEVVSLAGGMPYTTALPYDVVGDMVGKIIKDKGPMSLQYGSGQGEIGLRESICDVMALEGINASPEDVVVTVGSQQALDLITRIFIDPGDVILAEAPSYVGALGTFQAYQAETVHVPMDEDGLIPAALLEAIAAVTAQGKRIKFLYTIPNFHNPAGVTLSLARRTEILAICKEHGILVMEDNPYGLLGFDEEPYRAMRADDADNVIYLGSFSKTFAPGLRVGWALAPPPVREKLVLASEAAILCPSNFTQAMIHGYLTTMPWLEQVKVFRELYRERRDATIGALEQMMPAGTTWTQPRGGFYVWVKVPEGLDSKAMLPRAVTARVAYVPGTGFFADGSGRDFMRLSYCYPPAERIVEGVRRLAGVIEEELELRNTFGASAPKRGEDGVTSPSPDMA